MNDLEGWSNVLVHQSAQRRKDDDETAAQMEAAWEQLLRNLCTWSAEELFTYWEQIPGCNLFNSPALNIMWERVRDATKKEMLQRMEKNND